MGDLRTDAVNDPAARFPGYRFPAVIIGEVVWLRFRFNLSLRDIPRRPGVELINGKLRYALGDLAALPRAAVVVEERYSQVFKLDWVRPAVVADGLAELQIRWPTVSIVFCETRQLAEEWTYRYLAAARAWAGTELALAERIGRNPVNSAAAMGPSAAEPTTSEVRAWARANGITVPDRGRLHPDIWQAWRNSQQL